MTSGCTPHRWQEGFSDEQTGIRGDGDPYCDERPARGIDELLPRCPSLLVKGFRYYSAIIYKIHSPPPFYLGRTPYQVSQHTPWLTSCRSLPAALFPGHVKLSQRLGSQFRYSPTIGCLDWQIGEIGRAGRTRSGENRTWPEPKARSPMHFWFKRFFASWPEPASHAESNPPRLL